MGLMGTGWGREEEEVVTLVFVEILENIHFQDVLFLRHIFEC